MSEKKDAAYWKERLQLQSHVEGGAFKEIYRSALQLPLHCLQPTGHKGDRAASTSIYFLLEAGEFSAFHRIASDELWHFYDGDTLMICEIEPTGRLTRHLLGKDPDNNAYPQVLIRAGSWFASTVSEGVFSLCGCTVAPGFDFDDFELADREKLQALYPQHSQIIASLTR